MDSGICLSHSVSAFEMNELVNVGHRPALWPVVERGRSGGCRVDVITALTVRVGWYFPSLPSLGVFVPDRQSTSGCWPAQ